MDYTNFIQINANTRLKQGKQKSLRVPCPLLLGLSLLFSSLAFGQSATKPESDRTGTLAIVDFGGAGNGTADTTDSFNAAVHAAAGKSLAIDFPCGIFRFSRK